MSIATQIERLQGVRDQIRTKMVGLGLSENTDLLQNLADDLDGVDKISPTNNGTTDPGTGYTNVDTLSRSTSTRYIKVPKGYNDTNRKFTINGVANGVYSASVSSHTISNAAASSSVTGSVTNVTTTTKPAGTDGTDYYTITPKLSTTAGSSKATGKATIDTAGYLAAGNKSSSESSKSVEVTASQGSDYYLKAGAYSASVSSHTTTNATASSKVSGSIVNITSATKPSTGNDGADYFTITPKLTTAAGSSKATGKATVDTAGYLATGNTTSEESSKSVGVTASQGSSYYLKAGSYSASVASHEVTDATAGSSVAGSITNITSTTKPSAGTDGTNYYTITPKLTTGNGSSKATGKATISANGFLGVGNKTSSESSKSVGVTATQGDNYYLPAGSYSTSVSSHTTSNATASSSVTGSITGVATTTKPAGTDGTNYYTITPKLTTTAGSSKATGKATIDTSGYLATGSATSSESSKTVSVTATQGSDYYLKAGSYSASVASHEVTDATASSSVTGSVTDIATTTAPTSGTDGTDYYTITPKLTTGAGSSKATGKATVGTAGYLVTGSTTSGESSKSVGVTATQGDSYYLKAGSYSASVASHTASNATASSSVTGSITNIVTSTKPSTGTDGSDYYTITPKLTTTKGSSKAKGKATISTAGYLATGNTTSSESSVDVGVTATQGDSYYLKAGSYSASVASHEVTDATAGSSVTGTVTNIATTTKPSGTDGTDYYTITPKLTTGSGSSKAIGKAAVDTAGYLATGNTTSTESSKSVGVTASQGDSYYLKASSVTKENPGVDPGNRYGNRATVDPSMKDQYVKITGGYLSDSKITIKKMTEGSVSSATTTDPGTENQTTVTPSLDEQYVKISAGHLPHSKITVEAIPNQKKSSDVSAEVSASISNITSMDASQATSGVTVTASASGNVTVPLGYYSSAVTSTPTDSASTTIKPTLAGTNSDGAVSITASTTDIIKTSAGDYSNGFITSVKVNPTPSQSKSITPTMAGGTVSPDTGKLLSSVTVKGVPSFRLTLSSSNWKSDSNVTIGKYYYNVSGDVITASNNIYVMPESASTSQSFGVYAYSQSKASGASTGTLQFRAIEKPTSDLGYTLHILNS